MEMNSQEKILTALNLGIPDRIPWFEQWVDPGIQEVLLGRKIDVPLYPATEMGGWRKVNNDWNFELAYSASPEFVEKFHLDALGVSTEPPLIAKIRQNEQGEEVMVGGELACEKDLKKLRLPDPSRQDLYEPVKRFVEKYKGKYALFTKTRTGANPAVLSMGIDSFSYALFDNVSLIEKILDTYTDWAIRTTERLNKIGLDFFFFADDVAYNTGPIMSPQVFRELFLPRMKKVADAIKIPWIYHSDGNFMPILDDLLTLGMNGLNPIQPDVMDIAQLKKDYGSKVCLVGNVDVQFLGKATPREVKEVVRHKISSLGPAGYILASSNSITSFMKPENVVALSEAVLDQ